MTERKILFRGFHVNKRGKTTTSFDGMTFKGEWWYWDEFARRVTNGKLNPTRRVNPCDVLAETISRWVKVDKNGNDVFRRI